MDQPVASALVCQREQVLKRNSAAAEANSSLPTLDKMPVELILHIVSYLHFLDFFPFKLANRYIYSIISSLPRPTFADYIAGLEDEDDRRTGAIQKGRPALVIAASRGEVALVMRLQKIARRTYHRHIHDVTTFHGMVSRLKWERYRNEFALLLLDKMNRSPLHWAAENGQVALVTTLVSKGARIWLRDKDGKTALDLSVQNGHRNVAELLIQKGFFRINSKNKRILSTALHIAAAKGLDEIVCLLLDHGAHVEAEDISGQTALYYAITAGQEKTVKLLLERGAPTSSESSHGQTMAPMIHSAATVGNTNIYKRLLDYGADPGTRCQSKKTALHHAASGGHNSIVQLLLDSGTLHVDVRDMNGDTPFRCAAYAEHTRTVLLLLDRGANINACGPNDYGNTALHVAAISGNGTIACLLLDRGADIEATNSLGRTPLLCATASDNANRTQVICLLLDYGAKINTKDNMGRTALHNAVKESRFRGDVTLISLLLRRGADINARDYELQTPLHHAANSRMERIYQILKDCGADDTARDHRRWSPKDYYGESLRWQLCRYSRYRNSNTGVHADPAG